MTLEELHIEKVPSVPQVLLELLRLCHQPIVDFDELAKVVEQEPALSAKILQAVNNVFYRQWSEVTNIRRLLVVLGLDRVRQIAVTTAVHQFFAGFRANNETFVTSVWIRSLFCAYIAQDLARLTGYPVADEAYVAGLLHRIGQLVLLQNFPNEYQDVLFMDDSDAIVEQVERKLFGMSYCDVGAALIRNWPIHPFVGDAVLFQNMSQATVQEGAALVKLLNLANRLTQSLVRGPDKTAAVNDGLFGLNVSLLSEVFEKAHGAVIEGCRSFGINAEPCLRHLKAGALAAEVEAQRQAHEKLGVYVQNSALLGAAQGGSITVPNEKAALDRIRRDLAMVFSLQDVGFFLCSEDGQRLVGVADDSDRRTFSELTLSCPESSSLAAQSLRDQTIQCTFQDGGQYPASIVDQQLRHLFAAEGLLFLPLLAAGKPLGVVVAALSKVRWQYLLQQLDLLDLFSQQLAHFLDRVMQLHHSQQQQLVEQLDWQRLETRKLVHEANNPLAIINNYLHILGLKLGADSPASKEIAVIKEEIARVADLLARMRDVAPPAEEEGATLDLNRVIEDLFRLFDKSLFQVRKITAELDLDKGIPKLSLPAGAVKQILMNLVKNAAEAMSEGGTLRVSTRDRIYKNGSQYVELQVCDNGPGLPDQVLSSLFKPVASTKQDHAGLGLAIVKNLLDRLSAEVTCSSATTGTRFQMLLPRTVEKSDQP